MKSLRWMGAIAALFLLTACAAPRSASGQDHPHYLHALSDLRLARAILDRPQEWNVMRDQQAAMESINHAIGEIKRASIDDRKELGDHPPIDARLDHRGRLRRVLELLDSADRDLHAEEDNFAAKNWRNEAIRHVNEARHAVGAAMEDKRLDQFRE
jgi:hypothetical protein